jgi:hypothetical protein
MSLGRPATLLKFIQPEPIRWAGDLGTPIVPEGIGDCPINLSPRRLSHSLTARGPLFRGGMTKRMAPHLAPQPRVSQFVFGPCAAAGDKAWHMNEIFRLISPAISKVNRPTELILGPIASSTVQHPIIEQNNVTRVGRQIDSCVND